MIMMRRVNEKTKPDQEARLATDEIVWVPERCSRDQSAAYPEHAELDRPME